MIINREDHILPFVQMASRSRGIASLNLANEKLTELFWVHEVVCSPRR